MTDNFFCAVALARAYWRMGLLFIAEIFFAFLSQFAELAIVFARS
jgi:hypothetical protein